MPILQVTHRSEPVYVYDKMKNNDITDFKFPSGEVRQLKAWPTNSDFHSVFEKILYINKETKAVDFTEGEIQVIKKYSNVTVDASIKSIEQDLFTLTLDTSKTFKGLKGEKCYGNESQGHITYNTAQNKFSIEGGTPMFKKGDKLKVKILANGVEIKEERELVFEITKVDTDGEDIGGWHGKQIGGKSNSTIFILND